MSQNQQKGLISVIMPCFNAESYLREAVESVLSQTYPQVELIVVDDGSTDRSREILESFGEKITVFNRHRQGPYPARNLGIKSSQGEFIAFLDADDYWRADCLNKLHQALIENGADLAYCGWQNVGIEKRAGKPYIPPNYELEDTMSLLIRGCPWPIHGVLTQRTIIEQVGGFSERYGTSMDFDLWLRIAAVTRNFVKVPEVLAFYRWHNGGQISSRRWEQAFNSWKVRSEFIKKNPQLVQHIDRNELRDKIDGYLLKSAYRAYWERDLRSAQRLFRLALSAGYWKVKDLRYAMPALLPEALYRSLIEIVDRRSEIREKRL